MLRMIIIDVPFAGSRLVCICVRNVASDTEVIFQILQKSKKHKRLKTHNLLFSRK